MITVAAMYGLVSRVPRAGRWLGQCYTHIDVGGERDHLERTAVEPGSHRQGSAGAAERGSDRGCERQHAAESDDRERASRPARQVDSFPGSIRFARAGDSATRTSSGDPQTRGALRTARTGGYREPYPGSARTGNRSVSTGENFSAPVENFRSYCRGNQVRRGRKADAVTDRRDDHGAGEGGTGESRCCDELAIPLSLHQLETPSICARGSGSKLRTTDRAANGTYIVKTTMRR